MLLVILFGAVCAIALVEGAVIVGLMFAADAENHAEAAESETAL